MRRFSWRQATKFVGIGKLVETLEAKDFEEKRRGLVEQRPAGLLGAPGDANDLALQQRGDDAIDRDAAHRFDFRPADRLPVGDHRERFQRWLAEFRRLRLLEKPARPRGELAPCLEHIPASNSLHHQARAALGQPRLELGNGIFDFLRGALLVQRRLRRRGKAGRLHKSVRDGLGRQRPICREEQRLDDTGQIHSVIF